MPDLVVIGAHLRGQPLHHQLQERQAVCIGPVRTAACYRLYALAGQPPKPGLLRVSDGGVSVPGEHYQLTDAAFGSFVAAIPAPLGIGRLLLSDGRELPGFLCEAHACAGATDISASRGWLNWLAQQPPPTAP